MAWNSSIPDWVVAASKKGSQRQRHRRKPPPPPVPYAPTATGRKAAREAGAYNRPTRTPAQSIHSILSGVNIPPNPESETLSAALLGANPDPQLKALYGKKAYDAAESARIEHIASEENLGEPEDITHAIEALTLLTGAGEIAGLVRGAGKAGAAEVAAAGAKQAASSEVSPLVRALTGIGRATKGGVVRGAAKKAAAKAEPAVVRSGRQAVADAAKKLPTPVRVAGKAGAQAVTYPVKHPFTAPLAIQTPAALVHGDPGEYMKALEGKGTLASITGLASHVAPIVGEAASLPAAVLPSTYLLGKAGVNAAQGDSKELDELKKQWLDTGLLPALAAGDGGDALKRLGEHPLYSLLEASGAASVAGRGAGAIAREATGGRVGGLQRGDLPIEGTPLSVKRRYSRDLIRQSAQRGFDRTRAGQRVRPDTFRGRHFLKEAANRFESGEEAIRKAHIHGDLKALRKTLPKKWGKIDRKSAEVVNLAVERIIRHPETFAQDLPKYKEMLEVAAKELGPDGKPVLDRHQLANNKALLKQIEVAESLGPERIHGTVHAANAFIELQHPILEELVDLKLLTEEQAANASATGFGRVHMGADYKEGVGRVDKHGEPLPLEAVQAEMQRQGIEPPGFLSHRPASAGDFYQPNFGGAMLEKGVRTGESVATGSQVGGIEGLVRQLRRSRGLVDRAKAWNKAITRFGIEVPGVKTWADAKRVLRDPARYGLDRATEPVAVPRHPFMAKKAEIEGALEHQSPEIAGEEASIVVQKALDEALTSRDPARLPDDTPVVFFPGKVAEQLRGGATPAGPGLRGAQAATTMFTRTVLPFSPGWYLGNGLDNAIRTALAGINPAHFLIGSKAKRELTPEQEAELLAGAHYSSVAALNPHRSVEAVVRGYDPLSKTIRQASEWSGRHGWKQAVVKLGPEALSQASNVLIAANKVITEDLPQRGALGKLALAEMKETQGSWTKALIHQKEIAADFAKKAVDPDKMIQFQKDLENVYGNYTRMSPAARKVLRNISPFWTWFRAAYKFVYVTMPVHHPIATAALTAGSRATQPTREEYGLDKEGTKPLPSFMQGGIPLPGGGIFPAASYSSFGYASDPIEAVARLPFPQYRGIVEALSGRDWKGDALEGGDSNKILTALWTFATAFVPGAPLLAQESEGKRSLTPHLPNLPHPYDAGYVQYKREPTQQITVPVGGSSGSSGIDFGNAFGGSSSSGIDFGSAFGGN